LGKILRAAIRWLRYAVLATAGILALIVLAFAMLARFKLPDLRPWHRLVLAQEFKAGDAAAPRSFEEYRRLEDRLFAELRRRLVDNPQAADDFALGRYNPRSVPAHLALETPYNRSYELVPPAPRGSVLLVHGLSDSPYVMHSLAETFFAQGYYVLVLRLPGHGTIPSGLLQVTWEDWYAAVDLAARHAAQQGGPGKPFLVGGFSTGAALVTLYTLRGLEEDALPKPSRLTLLSPAIGISKLAVLTNIVSGLSFIPWFEKSRWTDVQPEYDPYKYNSFPVNAANQIYKLTRELRRTLLDAKAKGRLQSMPPVTVFQSLIDATVQTPEVVRGLLAELPGPGNELVVFDVNRQEALEGLLAPGPLEGLERLRRAPTLPFRLVVISNRKGSGASVMAFTREAGAGGETEQDLGLAWPRGVVSLGHVALPFPVDDPIYGLAPKSAAPQPDFRLGAFDVRGESGALLVPLGTLARLRSNPFFAVIQSTIAASLAPDSGATLVPIPASGGAKPPRPEASLQR
jgi:alpha-beta hydrolase superfamily lysophospholipase